MFKYLVVHLALEVIGDQICVRLADRTLRNTPQFFEEIVAKAELIWRQPGYTRRQCELAPLLSMGHQAYFANAPSMFFDLNHLRHAAGPILWIELPFVSTPTLTGISSTLSS
jgi:hypothetical protein